MFVLSPVFCTGQKKVWMDDWNNASLSLSLSCNFISRDYNTRINFSFVQQREVEWISLSFFFSLFAVFNLKKKKESYEIETRHGRIIGWKMLFLIINVVIISRDNSYRGKKKCISRIILKNYRASHRLYEGNNIEEFQNEDLKPENRF